MIAQARTLWGPLWWVPPLPWVGYGAVLGIFGQARWEHVALAVAVPVLVYASAPTRRFFMSALPLFTLFLLYDSMRYWENVGVDPGRILGCELHRVELLLFGIPYHGVRMTPNEFFAIHHAPLVDFLCSIPYGIYLMVMVGTWGCLYATDGVAARRFAWGMLATHVLGFATYHLLPAAPPWYIATHGCVIDLRTKSFEGSALSRVDTMMGITYFKDLYARSSAVFGALPSLHAAYPFFGIFATQGRVRMRWMIPQYVFAALMLFATVYLGHHYVLDALLGVAYAAVAFAVVRRLVPDSTKASAAADDAETVGLR
jgi:hypothetical protein